MDSLKCGWVNVDQPVPLQVQGNQGAKSGESSLRQRADPVVSEIEDVQYAAYKREPLWQQLTDPVFVEQQLLEHRDALQRLRRNLNANTPIHYYISTTANGLLEGTDVLWIHTLSHLILLQT